MGDPDDMPSPESKSPASRNIFARPAPASSMDEAASSTPSATNVFASESERSLAPAASGVVESRGWPRVPNEWSSRLVLSCALSVLCVPMALALLFQGAGRPPKRPTRGVATDRSERPPARRRSTQPPRVARSLRLHRRPHPRPRRSRRRSVPADRPSAVTRLTPAPVHVEPHFSPAPLASPTHRLPALPLPVSAGSPPEFM
jgi:hypothetical protein